MALTHCDNCKATYANHYANPGAPCGECGEPVKALDLEERRAYVMGGHEAIARIRDNRNRRN